MHIGILQTGHAPGEITAASGDYDTIFRQFLAAGGFSFRTYKVVDMEFPTGVDQADGWLITGSKHGAYEDHPFIPPLEDFIRAIQTAARPLVGVCFGHQIIAQALGGRVEKFAGGWCVGYTRYRTPSGTPLHLNAWHQDQVTQAPAGAVVEATNDFCTNAILSYGPNIWTIQPHPEFDDTVIRGLIAYRGTGIVPEDLLQGARDGLGQPTDGVQIAARMVKVLSGAQPDALPNSTPN